MSYITLTYYPPNAGGTGWGSGVEKTLADWAVKTCTREAQNQAQDNVGIDLAVNANSPDVFQYGGKIVIQLGRQGTTNGVQTQPSVFTGGKIFFVGYRIKNVRSATGRMQEFKYKFTGPWGFFLDRHVFQKLWPTWNGSATVLQQRGEIILGQSVSTITQANGIQTTMMTIAEQVVEICNFTITQTIKQYGSAQFQVDESFPTSNFDGVGGWEGYCPMDAANNITCADAIKKTCKIIPAVSMWFDYSTSLPTLHIATRDTLPSTTLNWGNEDPSSTLGNYTSTIDKRDDLLPVCVCYQYRITTTVNGQQYVQIVTDLGCAAGATNPYTQQTDPKLLPFAEYFGAEVATFDFEGGNVVNTQLTATAIPFNPGTDSDDFDTWTQVLASGLNDPSVVQSSIVVPTNTATGGPYTTSVIQNGAAADPRYQYFMVGGPVPQGVRDISNPNLQQGVQMQLSCPFQWQDQTLSTDGHSYIPGNTKTETKSVSVYGFSIGSGIFSTGNFAGEPVPFGLANFVYNIEAIVQYDGTHGVVEHDPQTNRPTVTDVCPIGTNLNLSGGLPEYLTMIAQVQTVSYDLMTGHTDISFGVASHLGGTELIERLRINAGPRWLYGIAASTDSGMINPSGASSGLISGPTQLKDTQGGASNKSVNFMPAGNSGTSAALTAGSMTGYPGITHDVRTTGQPNYGGIPAAPVPNGGGGSGDYQGGVPNYGTTPGTPLAAPTGPTHYAQDLTSGAVLRWSTTDAKGQQMAIFEYPCCWDFGDGNGTVPAFVRLFGCMPYRTRLG